MNSAETRIRLSWAFAAAGALIGAVVGSEKPLTALLLMVLGAYVAWALFWGLPPAWRVWTRFLGNLNLFLSTSPFVWFILILAFFYIPIVGGYMYGMLGGAIYEFMKCRRRSLGLAPTQSFATRHEPTLADLMLQAEAKRSSASTLSTNLESSKTGRPLAARGDLDLP